MLTLETKISREIQAIEKLEVRVLSRFQKLKQLVGDEKPPVSISETLQGYSVKKNWGPGRKIPQGIKLEIVSMLQNGVKPKEINRRYNVSLPSIQKIKESAGLVKKRSLFR